MIYEDTPYNELAQTLNELLEQAKKHPFKVPLDFETRFRVWDTQILPDRVSQIRKDPTGEHVHRLYILSAKDVGRLCKRAYKEFMEVADLRDNTSAHLKTAQSLFSQRKVILQQRFADFTTELKQIELRG